MKYFEKIATSTKAIRTLITHNMSILNRLSKNLSKLTPKQQEQYNTAGHRLDLLIRKNKALTKKAVLNPIDKQFMELVSFASKNKKQFETLSKMIVKEPHILKKMRPKELEAITRTLNLSKYNLEEASKAIKELSPKLTYKA
jgi:hypothetical protein